MNTIIFNVRKPNEIPALSKSYPNLEVSERFFAKVKAIGGDIVDGMAMYDFKKTKWIFTISGHKELIEYYTNY